LFKALNSVVKRSRKPIKIALGIGLGPFYSKKKELEIKQKLQGFEFLCCRDFSSVGYCDSWNIPSLFGSDLCYLPFFKKRYNFNHVKSGNSKLQIGIVLRDWHHNDLGNKINGAIFEWIRLNNHLYDISFFVFSNIKDSSLIHKLKNIEGLKNKYIWDPATLSTSSFFEKMNSMDIFLTSRFHTAIFASIFCIPTICLIIDPKLSNLTKEIDGFFDWEADDSIQKLDDMINNIKENYDNYQSSISVSSEKLRQRALPMLDKIREILNK